MNKKELLAFLGWSAVINFAILLLSWLIFISAHELTYSIWSSFHSLTVESFDELYILIIGIWKILILVFNLVPYLALRIVERRNK